MALPYDFKLASYQSICDARGCSRKAGTYRISQVSTSQELLNVLNLIEVVDVKTKIVAGFLLSLINHCGKKLDPEYNKFLWDDLTSDGSVDSKIFACTPLRPFFKFYFPDSVVFGSIGMA